MLQQQTIQQPASFSGIGLHSGNKVGMTFQPAPPGAGIRFKRVDLDGAPEIEAKIENVSETNRSTTISKGNIKIHTVEHLLSTFAGLGVDNLIVELDSNEPPIADGSAREYARMIHNAGIVPQAAHREVFTLAEPISLALGDSNYSLIPHDRLRITCTSADKGGRFTQYYSLDITPESWEKEISSARTFCFFEEIEFLIKNGLIKGGSLENAVVIREDAILTNEPLRYNEEFVRHKILDILGDLFLLGRPFVGHIIAIKPSHAANCEITRHLAAMLNKVAVAKQSFTPPAPQPKAADPKEVAAPEPLTPGEGAMSIDEVMKFLPHRYPFLMVDRVLSSAGNKIAALKNVTINEPFFQGHFPGHPIMPGVLQLEAIAQVAGILMLKTAENFGKVAYFMSAENVKWRSPVRPGDCLVIEVELTKVRGKIGKAKGVCLVNSSVVSEADVTFMLVDP